MNGPFLRHELRAIAIAIVVATTWLAGRAALASRPVPVTPAPAPAIDLDDANEADLLTLEGVGPALARRLLDERDARGPFTSAADVVRRVRGVGPALVARWGDRIRWPEAQGHSPRPVR